MTPSGPPGVSREAKLPTKFEFGTVCESHFRNPAVFNILKPFLVQKQTLTWKALDLCYARKSPEAFS